MNISHSLIAIAAVAAMALPGLALADRLYPERTDDPAVTTPPTPDNTTRAEVLAAPQQFRTNPITDDSQYQFVGGEIGWVPFPSTGTDVTPRTRDHQQLWDFNDHPATDYVPYRFASA